MPKGKYIRTPEIKEKMSRAKIGDKNPRYWSGKKLSEEMKKSISISQKGKPRDWQKGEKSHFWKGGIDPINHKIRNSIEYKLWRTAVFERDHFTCIWCGVKNGNGKTIILNADHIKPFALFPELRFAIDNGRTLCKMCHQTTDTYGRPKKIK